MLLLSEPKAPGGLTFATGQASTFLDVVDAAQENTLPVLIVKPVEKEEAESADQ